MEKKIKHIPDYKEGETVNDLFVVRFKKPIRQARNGRYFFELKLQDSKGEIMFKFWGTENEETIQNIFDSIKEDSVVKVVNGRAGMFNDKMDISVNEIGGSIVVLKEGEYDLKDFLNFSLKDPEIMFKELKELKNTISDSELKSIADAFFEDENFAEKFKLAPAAMYKHHGWVSGLLEHTLTVAKICNDVAVHHPELDRNLLLAGALLHDIGKMEEFEATTQIKVTDKGNLLGHIPLGIQTIGKKMDSMKIDEIKKQKLLHMILSHHGCPEFGSSKRPAFPEALLLSKADEMDAFVDQMIEIKKNAETGDSFAYTKDMGNIYLR